MKDISIVWVPIDGYSVYYVTDGNGHIKRVNPKRGKEDVKSRLDRAGYLTVRLYHNGKSLTRSVHRLTAETFLENPHNLKSVNHKNGNKLDNRAENLEWVTHAENILHAHRSGLIPITRKQRAVIDKCLNKRFASVSAAARYYQIPVSTCRQYLVGSIPNKTCLQFEAA